MKKFAKILFIVILILFIIISALCIWQWGNIVSVVNTFTMTEEEIKEEMNNAKKKLEEELMVEYDGIVSDFTAEEEEQIMKGKMTVEEAVAQLEKRYKEAAEKQKAEEKSSKNENSEKKENNKTQSTKKQNPEADKIIAAKTVELYSLKAYYLGQLGQLEAAAKRDYKNMPKEKRNLVGKKEIANKYIGQATGLMNACDGKVNTILAELKTSLEAIGADTSVVGKIRAAYESEKSLKKSYYYKMLD